MATQLDVRRIALALPDVVADGDQFRANGRLIAWPWMERVDPKRPRVANAGVLVVRVATEMDKEALLERDPKVFFTEPHYDGYAAILIRLAAIDDALLSSLIGDSWRLATAKKRRR